jgi:hypothetical protein
MDQRYCRRVANRAIKTVQRLTKTYGKTVPMTEMIMRNVHKRIKNRPAKMLAKFERNRAA